MKLLTPNLIFTSLIVFFLISCGPGNDNKNADLAPNAHQVKAEEVIQTSAYTYVRVSSDGRDYWIATPKMDVKEGQTYYWSEGSEMREFTSKELKRTFRSIFFLQNFSSEPITLAKEPATPQMGNAGQMNQAGQTGQAGQMGQADQTGMTGMTGKQPAIEHGGISVKKIEGGVTVAGLFSNRKSFQGKVVKIRGEVVKFSSGIMNKNWVHLQDGTKDGTNFDLTITTLDSVKAGDIVVFEGKVTLDKDFGAGYFYEVILEDAKLTK